MKIENKPYPHYCANCARYIGENDREFWFDALFIFARNIIHGDMLFFPMIARFYDWKDDTWTTLEEMGKDGPVLVAQQKTFDF